MNGMPEGLKEITQGEWTRLGEDSRLVFGPPLNGRRSLIAECGTGSVSEAEKIANAALIAAAPDHALFGACVTRGLVYVIGGKSPDGTDRRRLGGVGIPAEEIKLDAFDNPMLTDPLRAALRKALEGTA